MLYKTGAEGQLILNPVEPHYLFQYRCIAFPNDLDGGGEPRTSELTAALEEEFASGILWSEWGIDSNVIVCYVSWALIPNLNLILVCFTAIR